MTDGKDQGNSPTSIRQQVQIVGATPNKVYAALIDADQHAAITGAAATSDPKVGGAFTAWDDYITGTHLELEPGRRIVQSWRTTEFAPTDPDSRIEFHLEPSATGTQLTFIQTQIPATQRDDYDSGWKENSWDLLNAHFAKP